MPGPWFIPGTSHVFARGSFNGWGQGALTNNPGASRLATNLYSGTFHDTADANGSTLQYKYYIDTGDNWESPASTGGGNRTATLPPGGAGRGPRRRPTGR